MRGCHLKCLTACEQKLPCSPVKQQGILQYARQQKGEKAVAGMPIMKMERASLDGNTNTHRIY